LNKTTEITALEIKVAQMLGDAWNEYLKLPVEHPTEKAEVCHAIHACQDIVLARCGRRAIHAQPAPEAVRQDEKQPSFRARVLRHIEKMQGSRVTCTQVFQAIAGSDDTPSQWALQQIGGTLRQLGFKRCRSGGKDYYQL